MERNTGLLTQGHSDYIRLLEVRGKLATKPRNKPREIAVGGRGEWFGWFELILDQVNEAAIKNTAIIIDLIGADILCVVEADNRIALSRFNESGIKPLGDTYYDHVMLIDGNDDRGIDIGLLAKSGYNIESMVSHVDDKDSTGTVFSRDCAEYRVTLPSGETLLVLANHFKSKGYGSQSASNAKRKRQADRVRQIYETRKAEGWDLVAIFGDFNDTPASDPLKPLLRNGSDLVDVMAHPKFVGDGRPGTHGNGTKSGKFDYILLSPAISGRVDSCGIERRGVWGGKNGTFFSHIPEITKPIEAASDHAALWVDIS